MRSLERALQACPEDAVRLRVVAIDNASGDGTAQRLASAAPWVEVVPLDVNLGFAAGCNTALRRLGSEGYVMLLNPDVEVDPSFLEELRSLSWPRDLGAIGPLTIGREGAVERSARDFPRWSTDLLWTSVPAKLLRGGSRLQGDGPPDRSRGAQDVDWIQGSCMVMTRTSLTRVGSLDPKYFMYWEDIDWCRRARATGLRIQYQPRLVVRHQQGTSSRARPFRTIIAFHRSAFQYWHQESRSLAASTVVGLALTGRCVLKLAVQAGLLTLRRTASQGLKPKGRPSKTSF